ncbi:MAG: hypothetical protein AAF688_14195 [Bacteroidota bacterium]
MKTLDLNQMENEEGGSCAGGAIGLAIGATALMIATGGTAGFFLAALSIYTSGIVTVNECF